jgi:hypothetical protein
MLNSSQRYETIMRKNGRETLAIIENYTTEQLTTSLYLHSDNKDAMKLLHWYERLILLCKHDFERYQVVRIEEHQKIIQFITENKLCNIWAGLIDYISINGDSSRYNPETDKIDITRNPALIALDSEIGDTWITITKDRPTIVYGVKRDGSGFLECTDPYYGVFDNLIELEYKYIMKKISLQKYQSQLKQMATSSVQDKGTEESLFNKLVYNLIPFYNEKTSVALPTKWIPHHIYNFKDIRQYHPDTVYLDMLHSRKNTLNSDGVVCTFKNAGSIKSLFLIEDMTDSGEFYLLFKVTTVEGYETSGRFMPHNESIFCGFSSNGYEWNLGVLVFLMLEVYADLTCEFPKERKRLYALKEVNDLDDPTLNSTNLYVKYESYEPPSESDSGRRKATQKPHKRKMATRKLASGRNPSQKAIDEAKAHGIELEPGKTFVRPYWVGTNRIRNEIKE